MEIWQLEVIKNYILATRWTFSTGHLMSSVEHMFNISGKDSMDISRCHYGSAKPLVWERQSKRGHQNYWGIITWGPYIHILNSIWPDTRQMNGQVWACQPLLRRQHGSPLFGESMVWSLTPAVSMLKCPWAKDWTQFCPERHCHQRVEYVWMLNLCNLQVVA